MKIRGNTVGTPMPRTDYEQTNPKKADYLKGKEVLDQKIADAGKTGFDAQTAADNAQTAANNAQTAADKAQTAAKNAQTTADKAQTAADNAQTTADEALSVARSKQAQHQSIKITLLVDGWIENSQVVSAIGVTALNTVVASPDPDSYKAYTDAGVICTRQGEGTLVFECDSIPSGDILVNVTCFGDGEGDEGGGGTVTKTFSKENLLSGSFVRYEDGVVEKNSNYLRTDSIAIPGDCKVISHSFPFSETGLDGWAVYDASGAYIFGGKDTEFTVPDNAKTIMLSYKGSNTADASITFHPASVITITELAKELDGLREEIAAMGEVVTKTFAKADLVDGFFVRYEDGVAEKNSNYLHTENIAIPIDCEVIVHDFPFSETGIDGWAVYDAAGTYISGGKDTEFSVPEKAKSIMLSYKGSNTADASITFYPSVAIAISELNKELEEVKAKLENLDVAGNVVTHTFAKEDLIAGAFVRYADGVAENNSNYLRTDSITIPENCHTVTHTFPMSETGTDGWAMYDESGAYISGGKDKLFSVPANARTIMLSYKKSETGDAAINFWPGGKKIAFMGDSVTYGASPDDANDVDGDERLERPWPDTVGQLLKTPTINLGRNSATLMVGNTHSGNPTPLALVRDYVNYSDDYDIVGFMIGINDLYRSALNIEGSPYTLGTMEDRTADTFYGALHVFIKGMVAKYPPLDHKVFAMIYPYYHGNDKNRDLVPKYFGAIREVARYYALPVLDLEAELGVTVLNDPGLANGTAGVYWVKETNSHPTQAGADLIAQVVANFINSKFLLKSAAGGSNGKEYVLTEDDKTDIAEKVAIPGGEVWTFELEDGSSVTKEVVVK